MKGTFYNCIPLYDAFEMMYFNNPHWVAVEHFGQVKFRIAEAIRGAL